MKLERELWVVFDNINGDAHGGKEQNQVKKLCPAHFVFSGAGLFGFFSSYSWLFDGRPVACDTITSML